MHIFLALILPFQATGLEAGESFRELALMPDRPAVHEPLYGRVLDAFTGRPLAGARIETWTESINPVFRGFHRIGEARSGRDGRFVIRYREGAVIADKSRVMAEGYLTWSGTNGELYDIVRLFPRMKQSPSLRILDLEGRPIQGARITTTMTCPHDIPAFDLHSGADGRIALPEFGLQRDVQELQIRAPGYLAVRNFAAEMLLTARHLARPYDIYLARQRPFRCRIIDPDGVAISDLPIQVTDGYDYPGGRTDEGGVLTVEARDGGGSVYLRVLGGKDPDYIDEFVPPSARVPTLRIMAMEWPEETKTGKLRVDLLPLAAKQVLAGRKLEIPKMQIFHEDGWRGDIEHDEDGDAGGTDFPVGKGFVMIGGVFSGYEEEILDFDLEEGKTLMLHPKLRLEPRIQVQLPKKGDWTLTVQAGGDSKPAVSAYEGENNTGLFPVPGNRRLILYAQDEEYGLRKIIEAAKDGMKIDFTQELVKTSAARAALQEVPPSVTQDLRFFSAQDGKPLAAELSLREGFTGKELLVDDKVSGQVRIQGPAGSPWLADIRAKGYNRVYRRGRLQPTQPRITVKLEALASLEIKAPFEFKILGDDALDLEALPPGPLGLVLLRKNGRRYGLSLQLSPGAKRRITLQTP